MVIFPSAFAYFGYSTPKKVLDSLFENKRAGGAFSALCLALAGTMGVGNITGVALAIITGGPGSIFWMILSAFFAMAVKYAEVLLAMDSRKKGRDGWQGGAPFYMVGKGRFGRVLPFLFSLFCILCACLQGGVIQGNAAAAALSRMSRISPVFWGVSISILSLFILLFWKEYISRITAILIPFATLLYLFMCGLVIGTNLSALPMAAQAIFRSAFSFEAGVGGIFGFLFSYGARIGCARGLLSNEAGCGTAPLAHITAEGTTPSQQGLWGIFEVFLDTVVVCTLTALACLVISPTGADAHTYIIEVFASVFGTLSPYFVGIAVFSFAFSTTLTWAFYGLSCFRAICPTARFGATLYLMIYSLCVTLGACVATTFAFAITDILLAIMTLCNLFVLMKKADRVVALSAKDGFISFSYKRGCAPVPVHQENQGGQEHPQTPVR